MLRTLAFDVEVTGILADEVYAVTVHREEGGSPGPAIHRLMGPGQLREVSVLALGNRGAEDLMAGRLSLALYTASHPLGHPRKALRLLKPSAQGSPGILGDGPSYQEWRRPER